MRLTPKGQLTVPKKLREKFGLSSHTEVEVVEDGNTLRIIKKGKTTHPIDKVYGILQKHLHKKYRSTDDFIEEVRGR